MFSFPLAFNWCILLFSVGFITIVVSENLMVLREMHALRILQQDGHKTQDVPVVVKSIYQIILLVGFSFK